MGSNLADGVSQGGAGPDEFRTAPLWGLGQRIFFLHDGRTSDLVDAIREHASQGSEANTVISNFRQLSPQQKQDLLELPALPLTAKVGQTFLSVSPVSLDLSKCALE